MSRLDHAWTSRYANLAKTTTGESILQVPGSGIRRVQAFFVSLGSLGDTLPFIIWGRALAERGHDVTLLVNGQYRNQVEAAGLAFAETLTAEEFQQFAARQRTQSGAQAGRAMAQILVDKISKVYEFLAAQYVPGQTVVAAQGYAFGARIAQEVLGIPTATVHLQPLWLRSTTDSPDFPAWCPNFLPRAVDRVADLVADRMLAPQTNRFRARFGLAPVKRLMKRWWNSPDCVLGLFPAWFAAPQPDWPPNVVQPGFILERDQPPLAGELAKFVDTGEAPLVFTQTAEKPAVREFFEVSAAVARRLGRRAIFVAPNADLVPSGLPPEVLVVGFAPLARLLPRALLHIHHGGIGTIAYTLAAGIPQLTVPMVYDQPNNSQRLARLGVSSNLRPGGYRVDRVDAEIRRLLSSPDVASRCAEYAEKMRQERGVELACRALEGLAGLAATRSVGAS
jgi:UDP:flavonoid glycosyltransferase YjiC (YdhE family)